MLSLMFVQLNIGYYVGIRNFRELPCVSMVCSTEPGGFLRCFIFASVGALVLMDLIESINFYILISPTFSIVNWFEGRQFQMYFMN